MMRVLHVDAAIGLPMVASCSPTTAALHSGELRNTSKRTPHQSSFHLHCSLQPPCRNLPQRWPHFDDKMAWDRTASIFLTRWHETGLHSFLWQDCMRQDCIHFYDKMAWDRTASIFMTRWHETGLHSFLWQDCMRQDCIHFYDKIVWDRYSSMFMRSQHKTGTHPFLRQASIRPVLIHF